MESHDKAFLWIMITIFLTPIVLNLFLFPSCTCKKDIEIIKTVLVIKGIMPPELLTKDTK